MVDAQIAALRSAGHKVHLLARSTDEEAHRPLHAILTGFEVSSGTGPSPTDELASFAPDIVHVHNLFPNWGKSWVKKWPGPLVATLHNYRPMYAAGVLFRDGAPCNQCEAGGSWNAIKFRCYRGSAVQSIPLAIATRRGAARDVLLERADRLIVLSERARNTYEAAGVDRSALDLVPNFVDQPKGDFGPPDGNHWVYVGRLDEAKGIKDLMNVWPDSQLLHVYGDGPLRAEIEQISRSKRNIRFFGLVKRDQIPAIISAAQGLLVPSRLAEGAIPLTYIEALAAGRPVVSVAGNGAADDIAAHRTGAVAKTFDDIANALENVEIHWSECSARASARYRDQFTSETWLRATTAVYRSAIRDANRNR